MTPTEARAMNLTEFVVFCETMKEINDTRYDADPGGALTVACA